MFIIKKNLFNLLKPTFSNKSLILNSNKRYTMKLIFDKRLKGIKELDKSLFKVNVELPGIKIKKNDYNNAKRLLKPYLFESLISTKRIIDANSSESYKYILLDPETFNFDSLEDSAKKELAKYISSDSNEVNEEKISKYVDKLPVELNYDDFKYEEVIKAIIPDELLNDHVGAKSYSIIGHIAHFNLRDKILDYKNIIGQALIDKMPAIKTVVNKLNEIDNTYRNFKFEILAGEKNTIVTCKENNCLFQFDFANVYWNPRLSFEHERVVKMVNSSDVIYDVFAGVGPFSVPATTCKRVSAVLANDLNPESYRHLCDNYKLNNKSKTKQKELESKVKFLKNTTKVPALLLDSKNNFMFSPYDTFLAFNFDGRDFIRTKVKYHLVEYLNFRQFNKIDLEQGKFYVLMNLPALSIEFLDSFYSLYDANEVEIIKKAFDEKFLNDFNLNVYCYHFAKCVEKGDNVDLDAIKERIKKEIYKDESLDIDSKFVRKVSPNKDMFCSMFKLKFKHLFGSESKTNKTKLDHGSENEADENPAKVPKIE